MLYRGRIPTLRRKASASRRFCCIGENSGIYCHASVRIGKGFLAAPGLTINNGAHDPRTLQPSGNPVVIGDSVWCGVNVTILGGVTIGDRAILGANTLVISDVPEDAIVVGIPGRVTRIQTEERKNLWSAYEPFV